VISTESEDLYQKTFIYIFKEDFSEFNFYCFLVKNQICLRITFFSDLQQIISICEMYCYFTWYKIGFILIYIAQAKKSKYFKMPNKKNKKDLF